MPENTARKQPLPRRVVVKPRSIAPGFVSLNSINTIPAKPDFGERIAAIDLNQSWLDEIEPIEQSCFPAPWSRELLKRTLEQRVSFVPGLIMDKKLIGYSYNFIVVDELHVLSLAVNPKFQGQGLGRQLLSYVLIKSIERGVTFVTLEVRVTNLVAQKLYASLGFGVSTIRRRYYRDNGEDALVLERFLSEEDLAMLRRQCSLS